MNIKVKDLKIDKNTRSPSKQGIKELTKSVQEHGILEPLIVREDKDGMHLIAGYRRLEAAKAAGLKDVPIVVLKAKDENHAVIIQATENLQREDMTPLEEANTIKGLVESGMKQGDVANMIGKSKAYVSQRLKLLDVESSVRDAVDSGALPASSVRDLSKLDKKDQKKVVKKALDAIEEGYKLTKDGKKSKRQPKGEAVKEATGKGSRQGKKPGKKEYTPDPDEIEKAFNTYMEAFTEKRGEAPSASEMDLLDTFFVFLVSQKVVVL